MINVSDLTFYKIYFWLKLIIMKKIIFNFCLTMALGFSISLSAQTIPNSGFESWTSTTYDEPVSWTSSNSESLRKIGAVTTTSVSGSTGKGIRMQTKVIGLDTVFGYVFYGANTGDPTLGHGGLPYSQKPTNITGQCRYSLPGNDTAIIFVVFKKNGVIISNNQMKIRGTGNQPTFTSFNYTLAVASATSTPDSVVMAFASSNAISGVGIQNNSFLEIDELSFTGPGITQPIVNGSFENWTSQVYNKLNLLGTAGEGVSQVTPGQSGSYALELKTQLYSANSAGPSGVSNGYYPPNGGQPKGGQPYTQTLDTLFGYYKFSGSNDSGIVSIALKKLGVQVGNSTKFLKSQSNWTLFKVPISSGIAPDSMRLEIYSSTPPGNVSAAGSKLTIDNLYLKSQPTGLIKLNGNLNKISFFPNPSKDLVTLKLNAEFKGSFKVYDSNGRLVKLTNISSTDNEIKFNIESLTSGIYFVHLQNADGDLIEKFIKE